MTISEAITLIFFTPPLYIIALISVIFYGIYKAIREDIEDRKWKEVYWIMDCVFYARENDRLDTLQKDRKSALMKVKAIFDHLNVQVEISDYSITPSIDILRSLSFSKEYLSEIDEQAKILQDVKSEMDNLNPWRKRNFIRDEIEKVSLNKWKHLRWEDKCEMIRKLADEFDRKVRES